MTQSIDSQFDLFLFARLHEDGETPLSVLSALARQDIDAWQEAARLNHLPKEAAVNSLASTIWKTNSERWSPSDASIVAARLVELLPSHRRSRGSSIPIESTNSKVMMWLVYGILLGSIAISGKSAIVQKSPTGEPRPQDCCAAGSRVATVSWNKCRLTQLRAGEDVRGAFHGSRPTSVSVSFGSIVNQKGEAWR